MGIGFKWLWCTQEDTQWHLLLCLSLSHTRTRHTPSTQRLNCPSTPINTQAQGSQTAVRVCPRRKDAQTRPWARDAAPHSSVGIHLSLRAPRLCRSEPRRRAGSGAPTSTGAAPSLPAGDEGLRGIHFFSSLGAMGPRPLCPAEGQALPPGESPRPLPGKPKGNYQTLQGEPKPGARERCASSVPAASPPCGWGRKGCSTRAKLCDFWAALVISFSCSGTASLPASSLPGVRQERFCPQF